MDDHVLSAFQQLLHMIIRSSTTLLISIIFPALFLAVMIHLPLTRSSPSRVLPTPSFVTTPAMRATITPNLMAPKPVVSPLPETIPDLRLSPILCTEPSCTDESVVSSYSTNSETPSVMKSTTVDEPLTLPRKSEMMSHYHRMVYPTMQTRPPPPNSGTESKLTRRFTTFVETHLPSYTLLASEYSCSPTLWSDLLYLSPYGFVVVEIKTKGHSAVLKQAVIRQRDFAELTDFPVYHLSVSPFCVNSDLPISQLIQLEQFPNNMSTYPVSTLIHGLRSPRGVYYPFVDQIYVLKHSPELDTTRNRKAKQSKDHSLDLPSEPFTYLLASDSGILRTNSQDTFSTVSTIVSSSDDDDESHQTAPLDVEALSLTTANLVIDFLRPFVERIAILEAQNLELTDHLDDLQKLHAELGAKHQRHVTKLLSEKHYLLAKATAKRKQMNWDYIQSYYWNPSTHEIEFIMKPGSAQAAALFATR